MGNGMTLWMKFLIRLAIVAVTLLFVFWVDLSEMLTTLMQSTMKTNVAQARLPMGSTNMIAGFRIGEGKGNDVSKVVVSDLRGFAGKNGAVTGAFQLINSGVGVDFPGLRVHLKDGNGRTVRIITFGPNDYQHGSVFTRESVSLEMQLRQPEQSYTVEPFYP